MPRKVLIVDDNADQGKPLALILRHCGYEAHFVTNGRDAILRLRDEPVGLLILDLMMPGMSGMEVLRSIRSDHQIQHIPVVIYSACSDEREMALARKAGADDYWVKVSMRLDEICRRVDSYFSSNAKLSN